VAHTDEPAVVPDADESRDEPLAASFVLRDLAVDLPPTVVVSPPESASAPAQLEDDDARDDGWPRAPVTGITPLDVTPLDEDMDAVDAVDADLFPIFDEEAGELLPKLGLHLRDWHRRPSDPTFGSAALRDLHTFKGGARLAGAMRLGEMAHRLEADIEALLGHPVAQADVERLQVRADGLTEALEALRSAMQGAASALTPLRLDFGTPLDLGAPPSTASALAGDIEPATTQVAAAAPVEAVPAPEAVSASSGVDAEGPDPQPQGAEVDAAGTVADAIDVPPPPSVSVDTPEPAIDTHGEPAVVPDAEPAPVAPTVDWSRFLRPGGPDLPGDDAPAERTQPTAVSAVRVRTPVLERMVGLSGEVSVTRSRIEAGVQQLRGSLGDLADNLVRLREQLRDVEVQAETQMASRREAARAAAQSFDPLEFDRFTRLQELTRMMAESVNDVGTVHRNLQRAIETTEDELAAQARLTRDLQDDLLRTRMVEFEGLAERLYRVVRQAAKETGKQVRLDILGGTIEVDRGVLDRMTPAFEHLLRNAVAHGIEPPATRMAVGKPETGTIVVALAQEGNDVAVEFRDDGGGLDLPRIRERARELGLIAPEAEPTDADLQQLIFSPGFSTVTQVTGLAGRGIGMDVVRSEVAAMGGRIETASDPGQGSRFRLVLPLTTAVTQVLMLRCGADRVAVPATLVEIVRRVEVGEIDRAYAEGGLAVGDRALPFLWLGSLLQLAPRSTETAGRTRPVVVIRSAQQRVVLHVDEVLGTQEVVVKNLGPQLSRLPGLAGISVLASGAVALIYNPVALFTAYGDAAREAMQAARAGVLPPGGGGSLAPRGPTAATPVANDLAPLVLVVDDSLTVRRVTQRLLTREGYRVVVAKDGLDALERLGEERPTVVLSDIEMPRMDGFDLVRNIRADAKLRSLPVIMITSRIAQKHRDYAAELGVDHYLGKPYGEDDLLALVARYARLADTSMSGVPESI
jgi:chemosensory pili system protein ChpA (sensor histidine kinase/response regulator)